MKKHYKNIYVFLGNPFNKRYVEQALAGIPYEYRFNFEQNCAMYKLKNTALYGPTFVHNLTDILHENGLKILCYRNESNGGCLTFLDKAYHGTRKLKDSADPDKYI